MMRKMVWLGLIVACGATPVAPRATLGDAERALLSARAPEEAALARQAEALAGDPDASPEAIDEHLAVANAYWLAARAEVERRAADEELASLTPRLAELETERARRDEQDRARAEAARLQAARDRALREADEAIARAELEEARSRRRHSTGDPEGARHAAQALIARVTGLVAELRSKNLARDFEADERAIAAVRAMLVRDPVRGLVEIDRLRRALEALRPR